MPWIINQIDFGPKAKRKPQPPKRKNIFKERNDIAGVSKHKNYKG